MDDLAEVPEGAHLLYSAHGVSPDDPPTSGRAASGDDRRHVPAGDQGPPARQFGTPAKATRSC